MAWVSLDGFPGRAVGVLNILNSQFYLKSQFYSDFFWYIFYFLHYTLNILKSQFYSDFTWNKNIVHATH